MDNNDFEHLEAWELMVESRQYRNSAGVRRLNLRYVADFAFLDLMAVYILYNEYETAPVARRYADKTMSYRSFNKPRLSGTDLYVSLNILSEINSPFGKKISQNPEADSMLRAKLKINLPTIKRYLDLIADSKIGPADAATLLFRMEKQFAIEDSKLKSIRRLVQEWPHLTTMQRELVVTRMLQYYRRIARQSEMSVFLEDLGKNKGYKLAGPVDAELSNLGYGEKGPSLLKSLLPLAAVYGGYKLGQHLFGNKEDK